MAMQSVQRIGKQRVASKSFIKRFDTDYRQRGSSIQQKTAGIGVVPEISQGLMTNLAETLD